MSVYISSHYYKTPGSQDLVIECLWYLQSFPFNIGDRVKLLERPEPLEMKRVDSIFKERIERHKEELAELEEETKVIRRQLPVRPRPLCYLLLHISDPLHVYACLDGVVTYGTNYSFFFLIFIHH